MQCFVLLSVKIGAMEEGGKDVRGAGNRNALVVGGMLDVKLGAGQ